MLRPCPVLDNPGAISKMVHDTGAYSTEMNNPESANALLIKRLLRLKHGRLRRMSSLTVMSILQSMLKTKICIILKNRMRKESFLNLKNKGLIQLILKSNKGIKGISHSGMPLKHYFLDF